MALYERFLWPLLSRMDAETAHSVVLRLLAVAQGNGLLLGLLEALYAVRDPRLAVRAFGLTFPNPVGLAAGLDKDARAPAAFAALGFGAVEIGTLTPQAQSGNPRPRIYRLLEDRAIVNRMGFPNKGVGRARTQLLGLHGDLPGHGVLGINLGKSASTPLEEAASDYLYVLDAAHDLASYLVVNISSPNTSGLRGLQERSSLESLLKTLVSRRDRYVTSTSRNIPLLVKIAPDLTWEQLGAILEVVMAERADGIIATNTTLAREGLRSPIARQSGGLSGEPLRQRSTEVVRWLAKESGGRLPIVGVGGISHPDHALEKLDAGATLVQVYTGLIYEGPGLPGRICQAVLDRKTAGR